MTLGGFRVSGRLVPTRPALKGDLPVLESEEGAYAVVLEFEQPVRVAEGLVDQGGQHRREGCWDPSRRSLLGDFLELVGPPHRIGLGWSSRRYLIEGASSLDRRLLELIVAVSGMFVLALHQEPLWLVGGLAVIHPNQAEAALELLPVETEVQVTLAQSPLGVPFGASSHLKVPISQRRTVPAP